MATDCARARIHALDLARGRLAPDLRDEVQAHVDGCPACAQALEAERALDAALTGRLPRHTAPPGLRRRLEAMARTPPGPPRLRSGRWPRLLAPALAAALVLVIGGLLVGRQVVRERTSLVTLVDEAVSDHLRVLASQHPLEVESGGTHVVKPWFEGRLDFAPRVPAPEQADLVLRGGSVGYFLDRKAAVIQYALRLHAVTLIVFRADGLAWPAGDGEGGLVASSRRGFNVVLWRSGQLGQALVSDLNEAELLKTAALLARDPTGPAVR